MPFDAPFQLGPFTVGQDGRLALTGSEPPARFHLAWRGCRVDASLMYATSGQGEDKEAGELRLRAVAGRVPSTARGPAGGDLAERRQQVFDLLRQLPPVLPSGWQVQLTPDHRVTIAATTPMALPTSVTTLLTAVTGFLLTLAPYLDLLAADGVELPGAGATAGIANT